MSKGLIITGTDTEIGKTRATVAILMNLSQAGHKVAGMKPVASGSETIDNTLKNEDALQLQQHSNTELDYDLINPFRYAPPIAPHVAAQRANQPIDFNKIQEAYQQISTKAELTVVEGVGGWRVPFTQDGKGLEELATRLQLPVIMVVGMKLGCINHAILTAEAIKQDNCKLTGWIANHIQEQYDTTAETIDTITQALQTEPTAIINHTNQPQPLPTTTTELIAKFSEP